MNQRWGGHMAEINWFSWLKCTVHHRSWWPLLGASCRVWLHLCWPFWFMFSRQTVKCLTLKKREEMFLSNTWKSIWSAHDGTVQHIIDTLQDWGQREVNERKTWRLRKEERGQPYIYRCLLWFPEYEPSNKMRARERWIGEKRQRLWFLIFYSAEKRTESEREKGRDKRRRHRNALANKSDLLWWPVVVRRTGVTRSVGVSTHQVTTDVLSGSTGSHSNGPPQWTLEG